MHRSSNWFPILVVIGLLCIGLGVYDLYKRQPVSATPSTPSPTFTVNADRMWNNTGINLNKGDAVSISASGRINLGSAGDGADKWVGPDGWGSTPQWYSTSQVPHRYVYLTDSLGALRAKIGDGPPFKIGSSYSFTAPSSGLLYLGVEDGASDEKGRILSEQEANSYLYSNNRGSFTCTIKKPTSGQDPLVIQATDSSWHSLGTGPFSVEVSGGIDYGGGNNAGPNGSLKMGDSTALVEGLPFGTLVAKVGSGKPFVIGSSREFTSSEEVMVAINDSYYGDNKGSYTITKK